MSRFYNESDMLTNVGDYMVVKVLDPQTTCTHFDAILIRGSESSCYLMHNYRSYHGSCPRQAIMDDFGCNNSWCIVLRHTERNVIDVMDSIDDSGRGLRITKIYSAEEHDGLLNGLSGRCGQEEPDYYASNYEKMKLYCGQHSYHEHHGQRVNKPLEGDAEYKFGIEMEVEFDDEDERENFTDKTSNWFYCERDGSLNDCGCEIITIPLNPKDAKDVALWSRLTDSIVNVAEASSNCGLHVHVSRSIFGDGYEFKENLGKLLYLYHHHVEETVLNRRLYGRDRTYNAHDGKTREGEAAKRLGSKIFKYESVKNRVSDMMNAQSRNTRYFDINITNSSTIEFRKGAGTIDPKRVTAIVEYCELLCLFSKKTSWEKLDYNNFVAFIEKKAKNEMLKQIINQYK